MKRSVATALSAIALTPMLVGASVIGATPASADRNCDSVYPPGAPYRLGTSPARATISQGSIIGLIARVVRSNEGCGDQFVRYYIRNSGRPGFVPSRFVETDFSPRRGGDGFSAPGFLPQRSFNWFVQFRNLQGTVSTVFVTR